MLKVYNKSSNLKNWLKFNRVLNLNREDQHNMSYAHKNINKALNFILGSSRCSISIKIMTFPYDICVFLSQQQNRIILSPYYFYSMSSNKISKSTGKSIALITDSQLDSWNNNAKQKVKEHDQKVYSTPRTRILNKNSNIKSSQQNPELTKSMNRSFTGGTLNQFRQRTKSQKSQNSVISNRMKYIQVDRKRKSQMVQQAKNKYHRMIEVRYKSFKQKNELIKQREQNLKNNLQTKSMQASRIRSQRNNSSSSANRWKQMNYQKAKEVRQMKFQNQVYLNTKTNFQLKKKISQVDRMHQSANLSRQKILQINRNRVDEGKKNHHLRMFDEFKTGEMVKKKNTILYTNFQRKAKVIADQNIKYMKQLQEYQKFLGVKPRKNTKDKQPNSSFYLTNV